MEVGWEGVRSDGSERYGKNPRLKLMPFQHLVFASPFLSPLSSCFSIRMKMWIVVDSGSYRVCALSQHCTEITNRVGKGVYG